MMTKRGQIALEYGLVIGFSLLILIPTILIANTYSYEYQDRMAVHEAQRAADLIVDNADTVHLEGMPSRRTITVTLPANIDSINTINNTIIFHMNMGSHTVYATAKYANITWDASYVGRGQYTLVIQKETHHVRIYDAQ
ncbi:MAG: hypothetical protein ACMXYL_02025 [Candidatus Woesearchaeota archaeon]